MRRKWLLSIMLTSCFSDPRDPSTWIKKLDDPREGKDAVRELVKIDLQFTLGKAP